MESLIVSPLEIADNAVEIVERKGLGHPDTICDALAETLSRNLCQEYRNRFGDVLHYNVDKALLCGGQAAPAFGGGKVLAPINIFLAGRAITEIGSEAINIKEIAVEGSRAWFRENMHALDVERDINIHQLIQAGSQDLQELFGRSRSGVPLANDTSIGVGFFPLSPLESLVLTIEKRINSRDRKRHHLAWGEDVKIMGVRRDATVHLTVACAMIGCHLSHIDDYLAEKAMLKDFVQVIGTEHGFPACEVSINAADNLARNMVYLTTTGTSAEAGDDGQVGRGNRVNGLITPCRPMSLEAAAGKNPATHTGKIYNVVAQKITETLVKKVPEICAAHCLMVSRIGSPVSNPAILQVKLTAHNAIPVAHFKHQIEEIVADRLAEIPKLIDDFTAGVIDVF